MSNASAMPLGPDFITPLGGLLILTDAHDGLPAELAQGDMKVWVLALRRVQRVEAVLDAGAKRVQRRLSLLQ
eukprot:14395948-Alexandrium_andersonii.AAC.1